MMQQRKCTFYYYVREEQHQMILILIYSLNKFDEGENVRRRHEAAINSLEAYIFDMRDKLLTRDEYVKLSTEETQKQISEQLDAAATWMDEEAGADTPTEVRCCY
jgi:hypothetical protein